MNKNEIHDLLILKKDETALSLIKEMWALLDLFYMKIEDRNHAMRYQRLEPGDYMSELQFYLYRIECMIINEINYMEQQIEKEKGERDKSDSKVADNRYGSTLNHER